VNKIKAVIFDMDGLMFDTERLACEAWKEAASKFGYIFKDTLFIKTLGYTKEHVRAIISEYFGKEFPIEKIHNERLKIVDRRLRENGVPLKAGLFELLDFFKTLKLKMAVATSTDSSRATDMLKSAAVYDFFDIVICGDDIISSKPDPEIFLKAAEKLGCAAESCMVLEDSEAGILAASRAGMLPVIIPDMKQPSPEIEQLVYKRMGSLSEVQNLF
jgi:HAD superfamily hydrolase (TIGR01509 family)